MVEIHKKNKKNIVLHEIHTVAFFLALHPFVKASRTENATYDVIASRWRPVEAVAGRRRPMRPSRGRSSFVCSSAARSSNCSRQCERLMREVVPAEICWFAFLNLKAAGIHFACVAHSLTVCSTHLTSTPCSDLLIWDLYTARRLHGSAFVQFSLSCLSQCGLKFTVARLESIKKKTNEGSWILNHKSN